MKCTRWSSVPSQRGCTLPPPRAHTLSALGVLGGMSCVVRAPGTSSWMSSSAIVGLAVNQGCTNSILAAALFMADSPFYRPARMLARSLPCCNGAVMALSNRISRHGRSTLKGTSAPCHTRMTIRTLSVSRLQCHRCGCVTRSAPDVSETKSGPQGLLRISWIQVGSSPRHNAGSLSSR